MTGPYGRALHPWEKKAMTTNESKERKILEEPIGHETVPHCCGCWVIFSGDDCLYAKCNECGERRDILAFLSAPPSAPAAQQEPVAEFTEDDNGYITCRPLDAWDGYVGPLYTRPVAAQQAAPDGWYLQNNRAYVGNDMLFWARGGGYTTNLDEAEVFTLAKALSQHKMRETDIPWSVGYLRSKARPAVDFQYVSRKEHDAAAPQPKEEGHE